MFDPTPEEAAAYESDLRIDDTLYDELGERAWYALVYFNDPFDGR